MQHPLASKRTLRQGGQARHQELLLVDQAEGQRLLAINGADLNEARQNRSRRQVMRAAQQPSAGL